MKPNYQKTGVSSILLRSKPRYLQYLIMLQCPSILLYSIISLSPSSKCIIFTTFFTPPPELGTAQLEALETFAGSAEHALLIAVGVGRIPVPKSSEQKAVVEGPPPCTARRQSFLLQAPLFVTAGGVELVFEVVEVDCVLDVEDEDVGRKGRQCCSRNKRWRCGRGGVCRRTRRWLEVRWAGWRCRRRRRGIRWVLRRRGNSCPALLC